MSRIVHSSGGFRRYLQMSEAQFFAFVEGGLDRSFFDRLLGKHFEAKAFKYQVIAIREVPSCSGGKIALLALFREFRRRRELASIAFGKPMTMAFFADKDCDDFNRTLLRSPHLVYTESYDLEGQLFSCADLHRAIADACGLTMQSARQILPDQSAWLRQIVMHWKQWITLCLISHVKRVDCGCTYDRVSAINPNPCHAADENALDSFKQSLARKLNISNADFDKLYARVARTIDSHVTKGPMLRYFKGKWLSHVIQKYLETASMPKDASINGAGSKILTAMVGQVGLHSSCGCCAPFFPAVEELTSKLSSAPG